MGFMEDQDQLGKEIHEKRDIEKAQQEVADKAKEDAVKDIQEKEEDKKQGMI